MPQIRLIPILVAALALSACAKPSNVATDMAPPAEPKLTIIESPIAPNCFTKVAEPRAIDTVVVHFTSAIYWFNPGFQIMLQDEDKAYAKSINLTPETLPNHKYDWQLSKEIFEAYEVSSHYIIGRDGTVVRFVAENDKAWHAGPSEMPTDGRKGVNAFSIGIEITSSHPSDDPTVKTAADAYTPAQYTALAALIADIKSRHPITAVVGHDEIAKGRKNDPGPLFDWSRVRTPDYKPLPAP